MENTGELVVPGNIIFRQRGTKWHPGENCGLGRDHTIHANVKGYVRYYRDPLRHPKRRYIGVVFDKDQTLPLNPTEPRRRRLNMIAVPFKEEKTYAAPVAKDEVTATKADGTVLRMRSNYMFKEANWEIGRAAERQGIKVTPFKKNDRWLAWKKRTAKQDRVAELKAAQREKKMKKAANKAKGMEFARNKGKQILAKEKEKKLV
jgi:large subunit ribosomal protein L27